MTRIMKCFSFMACGLLIISISARAEESFDAKPKPYVTKPYVVPFKRPIGFTLNLGAITSLTAEGRFTLGLARNISLVVSPMFQNTPELPIWEYTEQTMRFFGMRRLNLGLGIRAHFYDYDSYDGWFIEALGRGGMTWIGADPRVWSLTPSLMAGYQVVYDSGYTVSVGGGFDWEFLLINKEKWGPDTKYLKDSYFGITKVPLIAELSIGWTW